MKVKATSAQKKKRKRERLIEIGCTLHWIKISMELMGILMVSMGISAFFCRGVWTIDVDAGLSSVLAGALCSTGPDTTEGVEGGARVPSTGLTIMKGAENIVWGVCPSSLVPLKGFEARRVQINASANASRFCRVLSDGHRPRMRVYSWSSRHADQMTQGSDIELGGSNVRPRSLCRYAGWVTIRCACSQLFTGRLGSCSQCGGNGISIW